MLYPSVRDGKQRKDTVDKDQLHALLYEALETEKEVSWCMRLPSSAPSKDDLHEEWEKYLDQTRNHVTVVPGIDFTNDPLLQGRLFSYTDTQLIRLGGPNVHEIPINRSIAPVHNNQRDGFMRQTINKSRAAYEPNTLGGGCPFQAGEDMAGFV
jgi:hypothetical protein